MKLLICIDDTDNLDSIGTGQLLENICADLEARGLAKGGFVTRHQLLIHEDIAYTSHNSSMCCQAETDDPASTAAAAKAYLQSHAAPGSDPGLCILQKPPPCLPWYSPSHSRTRRNCHSRWALPWQSSQAC